MSGVPRHARWSLTVEADFQLVVLIPVPVWNSHSVKSHCLGWRHVEDYDKTGVHVLDSRLWLTCCNQVDLFDLWRSARPFRSQIREGEGRRWGRKGGHLKGDGHRLTSEGHRWKVCGWATGGTCNGMYHVLLILIIISIDFLKRKLWYLVHRWEVNLSTAKDRHRSK